MSNFTCVGAKEVQAQHQLRGLPQAHHLKATWSAVTWLEVGPQGYIWGSPPTPGPTLSFPLTSWHAPTQAHEDTHLYVTLGRIPFSHRELQWFIVGVINLGDKVPIPGISSCSQSTPLDIFQL